MAEYIYLIIRTNELGEEKTVAACRSEATAQEWQAALDEMQEAQELGWTYTVEYLKVSG